MAERTLREQSGESSNRARQEVETASKLKDLPGTSRAFEDGQITYGHVRVIAKTAEQADINESELVEKAKKQPVDVFARTARRHAQERSGDDGMSILKQQRRNRRAWIRVDRGSGMTVLHAEFDRITGARVKSALSTRTNQLWRDEDPKYRPSTKQRLADALADLLCRTGDQGKRSLRSMLVLVAHYDAVAKQIVDARLGDGTPVPVEVLKDMACRHRVLPAIFDSKGQVLWAGLVKRTATPAQRMVLVARDRGCVGCGADPAWCQAR